MGLWNLALLISAYAPVLQLGVFNGLNRELPHLLGAGQKDHAFKMASASYAWCSVLTVFSFFVTLFISVVFLQLKAHLYAQLTIAIGIVISCSWMTLYLTATYRTSAEWGRLARNSTLIAMLGLLLVLLVRIFGFKGLISRAAILAILGVLALYYKRPIAVSPKWDRSLLLQLAKVGVPIWMLGQLDTIFMMLDRLTLVNFPELLGYYTMALQVQTFVCMIPIGFTMVLYPQMAHRYGESRKAMDIWWIATKGALAASFLGVFAGLVGWWLLPKFIITVIPKYAFGAKAAQWAAFLGLARGLSVYNNVYNVIKRQDIYLICLAIGVVAFGGGWILLTKLLAQQRLLAAVQSSLFSTAVMSISSAILSRSLCSSHDRLASTTASS